MFKWIVCAREPLHVEELREGVAFTLDDREYDPRKLPTDLTRLVRACGNLVVVDEETQVVQLAHHTVQQYLLQPDGSPFQFTIEDANITAGEFCVAYLSFSNFESQVTRYAENRNTDMSALGRIASRGPVIRPDHPGHKVVRVWNTLRNSHLAPIHIDMTRHVPHQKQAWQPTGFGFLHYVTTHWLWHTLAFGAESTDDGTSGHRENRRDRLFKNLILKKQLLFNFRPWGNFSREARHSSSMSLLGWALMANHRYLIKMASSDSLMEPHFSLLEHVWEATCEKFGWCATPSNKQSSSSTPYDLDVHFDDPYDSDSPTSVWLYSRLLWACREGHLEVLKELNLDIYTLNLNMIRYLVIVSAASGNLQMVQYLDRNHRALGQMDDFLVVSKLTNGQALTAIEHAAISGHLDIVTYLARRSTRPGRLFIDANFYSMLMDAAFDDNNISKIESLLVLLDLGLFLDGVRTAELRIDGFYPAKVMTKAVRMGHSEIVRLLLEYGVNPNTPDPDGFLPLIEAIKCSQDIIVSMLLEYKCSLDNTSFGLPLTIAAYLGNTTIARQLIQQGAEVFPESFRIDSAVDLTSLHENYPFYINHYSFKRPFNPKICFSPTPLYMACYHGHRSIVALLLNYGAAANFPSPLCLAWMSQSRDSCGKFRYQQDLHLNDPGPLNIWAVVDRRSFWELPITAAMNKGHMDIVEILISSRARRPEEFDFLCGSYFGSLDAQHEKFERLLADSMTTGSLPKSGNKRLHQLDRTSPTIPASRILSVAELEILAAASANIQQEHLDSQLSQLLMEMHIAEPKCPDPLHAALLKAAERQANDLVQALLLAGASISAPDGDGIQIPNPLLVSAARDGNRLLRRALLDVCLTADFSYVKRFKDLCPQEEIKRRELSLQRMVRSAVTDADLNYFGFPDYCKILVFDTVDRAFTKVLYEILLFQSGHSSPLDAALFAAVEHENHEIVRLLCAKGANINARRAHDGMTPLIYAAHRGAGKPVIEAILSYNADPKAFDRAGETAFYKAAVNCHFHVVEALVVSGKSTLRELIILLNLCVSIGNPDAWKAIVRRDMHEEVRLKRGDVVPSYNVSRGQYLLKRPCKHIQGLFEVQGPMDPIVQKQ
jgi:ankyrin repeat protein